MNLNLIAYALFLTLVIFIIIVVGKICYKNGNVFVAALLPGHEDVCIRINKLLLMGYYLLNIGYTTMTLISWQTINNLPQLVELITYRSAIMICLLAVMHYFNIFMITKYVQKLIQ